MILYIDAATLELEGRNETGCFKIGTNPSGFMVLLSIAYIIMR